MSSAETLTLEASDVAVTYPNGHTALRDASFRLAGGTICALVGVNGSGKSTLFKALMGFVQPTRGRVEINGRPVREAQKKSWVAYVPQAEEVDWSFPVSVHDVVMMGRYGYMNFLRIPRAADRQADDEVREAEPQRMPVCRTHPTLRSTVVVARWARMRSPITASQATTSSSNSTIPDVVPV